MSNSEDRTYSTEWAQNLREEFRWVKKKKRISLVGFSGCTEVRTYKSDRKSLKFNRYSIGIIGISIFNAHVPCTHYNIVQI